MSAILNVVLIVPNIADQVRKLAWLHRTCTQEPLIAPVTELVAAAAGAEKGAAACCTRSGGSIQVQ
jgi:hypothetical protein